MKKLLTGMGLTSGSILLWIVLLGLRWDYVVNVMFPGEALGEPIWVHDPLGFWVISIPCGIMFLIGFYLILTVERRP